MLKCCGDVPTGSILRESGDHRQTPSTDCIDRLMPSHIDWRCRSICFVFAGLFLATSPARLAADIFVLESGGRIEGEWLNRDEQPLTKYAIRTSGVTLNLPASAVRETIRESPTAPEYTKSS